MDINELQNAAIEAATEHIKGQRESNRISKLKLCCVTVVVCVLIICATVLGCYTVYAQQQTIIEQQYALNMQYAGLMEYVSGAEITESISDAGGGGIAVSGQGNTVAGGDVNG